MAIDKNTAFPEACKIILSDFYVNDLISGADTIENAKRLAHDIAVVLHSGCFTLRKWNSNSKEIIESMKSEPTGQIHLTQEINSKMLGLSWNTDIDTLNYQSNALNRVPYKITKRTILSFITQLFDPLGLINLTIVLGKIIMQKYGD